MEVEDLFRVLNIALAISWFFFMWRLRPWWGSRPREERLMLTCIPLLMILVLTSSMEALLQDVGFGTRVLFYTPVLILCIFASFRMLKKVQKIKREEEG